MLSHVSIYQKHNIESTIDLGLHALVISYENWVYIIYQDIFFVAITAEAKGP